MTPAPSVEHVLVFAPFGRDGESLVQLVKQQGLTADNIASLPVLAERLGDDTGAVVMTEEALAQQNWRALIEVVGRQPSWSAYPFILLIGQKRSHRHAEAVYSLLPAEVTNVVVLERPLGSATLLSAVRWALAGRRRQFVTKRHLEDLERISSQQRLMTRELAHRVKNTIAVLQSIVTQTMRPYEDMADVKNLIIERFAALARTHDLLLGKNFQSADFEELVQRTVSVHSGNFRLEGQKVALSPQASLSFALVLHELATNSVKYGALRSPDGVVSVQWLIGSGDAFQFRWREAGGPPVSPPSRSGFGTRLIRLTLSPLGRVDMRFEKTGFELDFQGPLQELTHAVVPDFDVP